MKAKMIIFALILSVVFVYLPNLSQAYVGPPYYPFGYPSEHPWQDQESPPGEDVNVTDTNFRIVIIGVPTKIIMIRGVQIKSDIEMNRQAPKKIEFGSPDKRGND